MDRASATRPRAAYISSIRPPASSMGAAPPPAASASRPARRVKDSTSQFSSVPAGRAAHMARSLSWEYCSGTMSRRRRAGEAPIRSSSSPRMSCPARACSSVSMAPASFRGFSPSYHKWGGGGK